MSLNTYSMYSEARSESRACWMSNQISIISIILLSSLLAMSILAQQPPKKQNHCYGAKTGFSTWMHALPPLRDMKPAKMHDNPELEDLDEFPIPTCEASHGVPRLSQVDTVLQTTTGSGSMPPLIKSWEGISSMASGNPPDTEGDVGLNDYVQCVNVHLAIWDKNGNLLYGPVPDFTLWLGSGVPYEDCPGADPVVLYDRLANRWLISTVGLCAESGYGPFYEYVAISQTDDPTGAWYCYAFQIPDGYFSDYAKFGIWPDGYYMSYTRAGYTDFGGSGVVVFDRAAMLAGQPTVAFQYFSPGDAGVDLYLLPSTFTGTLPPLKGEPNYFLAVDTHHPNQLKVWAFHTDWDNPANSYFGETGMLGQPIATAPFNFPPSFNCVSQPDGAPFLESLYRLMYRLNYRNMGSYQSLVVNHAVSGDQGQAGIRWYELRKSGDSWNIYQQGTFAPDSDHRWMGSCAMDHAGNMALGYSVSSSATYPSIRYAGRLATAPPNTLSQGEGSIVAGGGSQTGNARWGDYSTMSIDPADDCTFWYTQEYYPVSGTHNWHTRIAAFRFPNCRLHVTATATPSSGYVPLSTTFTVTTTNGQEPLSYSWDFSDGSTGSGPSVNHTYVVSGTFEWTVTVTDSEGQSVSTTGTLLVECRAITLSPTSIPGAAVGVSYSRTIMASGGQGPYAYAVTDGSLPAGLTLSSTGLLSGTPLSSGSFAFTLTARDANGCDGSGQYSISVAPQPVVSSMKKVGQPFRIKVYGSNLQEGIKVYINGQYWGDTSNDHLVKWKDSGLIVIKKGRALKVLVPKRTDTTFRFVNPDGGESQMTWQWP